MVLFGAYGVVGNFFNPGADYQELGELSESIFIILILAAIFLVGAVQTWFGISLIKKRKWVTRVGGFICCAPALLAPPPSDTRRIYHLGIGAG